MMLKGSLREKILKSIVISHWKLLQWRLNFCWRKHAWRAKIWENFVALPNSYRGINKWEIICLFIHKISNVSVIKFTFSLRASALKCLSTLIVKNWKIDLWKIWWNLFHVDDFINKQLEAIFQTISTFWRLQVQYHLTKDIIKWEGHETRWCVEKCQFS